MKKIITSVLVAMLAAGTIAAVIAIPEDHPDKYCAKMKDGKKVVMYQGSVLTMETALNDGSRIQPDGTIIKNNGNRTTLKTGECVNKDGIVMQEKDMKDKDMKDKDKNKTNY